LARLVDRVEELRVLDEAWALGRPSLIILYGRRRLGKTFLATMWARLRGHPLVYLVVNYSDPGPALADLELQLEEQLGLRPRLEGLRGLAHVLERLFCSQRRVLVLDEFQRLAEAGLPQLLQSLWDSKLATCGTGSMLVLLGSSVGVVERVALHGGAPLYGRASRILRLRPMSFVEAYPFLSQAPSPLEAFRLYAVFGGTPYYLSLLEPERGLEGNIRRLVLSPGAPLLEEPQRVLLSELREPDRYSAILEAVAGGASRLSEIAAKTGIAATSLPRYIHVLEAMGLIRRVKLFGETRSIYRVGDLFFRFWYRHVAPHSYLVEQGLYDAAAARTLAELDRSVPEAWEEESLRHFLRLLASRGEEPIEAGPYMRKGVEIDALVATRSGRLYALEAKWSKLELRDVERIAARLEAKLAQTPWARRGRSVGIAIYAREYSGPPPEDIEVHTLEELVREGEKTPVHEVPV